MIALHAQDETVARIGYALAVGSAPLCGASGWATGISVQMLSQYSADFRDEARDALHIGDYPTVATLIPGSPAAKAGIKDGDQITAIDGHRFVSAPATKNGGDFTSAGAALDAIDAAFADGHADLDVLRGSASVKVDVAAIPACRGRFEVRPGSALNAYSDGTYVQVSSELAAFTQNDAELAALMAHELSHNILEHPQRLDKQKVDRGIFGGFGRSARLVRETEVEADRMSVYVLTLSGYPIDAAVSFWTRFGKEHGLGIFADKTHPGWKTRVATIQAEAARIATLKAKGELIRPPADLVVPTK